MESHPRRLHALFWAAAGAAALPSRTAASGTAAASDPRQPPASSGRQRPPPPPPGRSLPHGRHGLSALLEAAPSHSSALSQQQPLLSSHPRSNPGTSPDRMASTPCSRPGAVSIVSSDKPNTPSYHHKPTMCCIHPHIDRWCGRCVSPILCIPEGPSAVGALPDPTARGPHRPQALAMRHVGAQQRQASLGRT